VDQFSNFQRVMGWDCINEKGDGTKFSLKVIITVASGGRIESRIKTKLTVVSGVSTVVGIGKGGAVVVDCISRARLGNQVGGRVAPVGSVKCGAKAIRTIMGCCKTSVWI